MRHLRAEFFDMAERLFQLGDHIVKGFDQIFHFHVIILRLDAGGVETNVFEDFHESAPGKEAGNFSASSGLFRPQPAQATIDGHTSAYAVVTFGHTLPPDL